MSTVGGCWVADAVPPGTFTPAEHCVELLRVFFSENSTPVLVQPGEKPFLILTLIREYAGPGLRASTTDRKVILALALESQIQPWRDFLYRSLNSGISGKISLLTHEELISLSELESISLLLIDNSHVLPRDGPFWKEIYPKVRASPNSRTVVFTGFLFNGDKSLAHLNSRLLSLEDSFLNRVETSCDLLTTLRYVSKPKVGVLSFPKTTDPSEIELQIEKSLEGFVSFLSNHRFSLEETYGEDFEDLIQDIPDPSSLPLKLIEDFLKILRTCGVWCAERAALLLTIKIDNLKTREKYERHYLLLSVLYSEMLKICKICDDAFVDLTEKEKISQFSKPKLLRMMNVLLQYKPEHITDNDSKTKTDDEEGSGGPQQTSHHRHRFKRKVYYSYDDPNALCGVVFVKDKFLAKILYHYLREYSKSDNKFSFLTPQYAVDIKNDDKDLADETLEGPLIRRKQEEALRRFRMRECNILISNSLLEVGIDCVRCNLILAFDPPETFHTWAHYKVKAKSSNSWFLALCREDSLDSYLNSLSKYRAIERSLVNRCRFRDPGIEERHLSDANDHLIPPYVPKGLSFATLSLKNSILLLNRYCAKLPSDTFTRLTPLAGILRLDSGYVCGIQLPINCPLKKLIVGITMPNETLAKRAAAYAAIVELHKIGELDLYMNPVGKDSTGHSAYLANRYLKTRNRHYNKNTSFTKKTKSKENSESLQEKESTLKECEPTSEILEEVRAETSELSDNEEDPPLKTQKNAREFEEEGKSNLEISKIENPKEDLVISDSFVENSLEIIIEEKDEEKLPEEERLHENANIPEKKDVQILSKTGETEIKTQSTFEAPRPGTTKRRQYYYKKFATCLKPTGDRSPKDYRLYDLRMKLSCPIPDDQNTRGRKIYPPENAVQKFGFLVRGCIPPICSFPIYTRSGEVMVEVGPAQNSISIKEDELNLILNFHRYTFLKVLRLEKYPMQFAPDKSDNSILILPMIKSEEGKSEIDWTFLQEIKLANEKKLSVVSDEDRKSFVFDKKAYSDAVIMPWYRNQDQPQYFYVAEICEQLNPTSDFPGQGFESFSKYYQTKYNITIQNLEQPLLDVDHTSHRLNFLTPRYVNRKGVALPTSSEETKRNKRENLEQKQILVPELCIIHPFPASLWRQTVSLPCILYRLNGLLIADDLRSLIAREMTLGKPKLTEDFVWAPLDFGWTLADVLKNRNQGNAITTHENPRKTKRIANSSTHVVITDTNTCSTPPPSEKPELEYIKEEKSVKKDDLTSLSDQLMNKMNEEDNKLKQRQLEIGTWSNELAEEVEKTGNGNNSNGGDFFRFGEEFDEEDLEFLDPNMALPDNLTLINNDLLPQINEDEGGSKDWGTGIEQKHFRVGSPTFFSNPNINIPGIMDDLDGLSCSDSDDDYYYDNESFDYFRKNALTSTNYQNSSVHQDGNVRIEFRGENMAEAIEDEHEETLRVESLARNLEEEAKMLSEIPWSDEEQEIEENLKEDIDVKVNEKLENWPVSIIKFSESFNKFETPVKFCQSDYERIDFKLIDYTVEEEENIRNIFLKEFNINFVDDDTPLEYPEDGSFGVIPKESDEEMNFSFDYQPDLASHPGPSPSIILQGLTMSNSNDAINLERLETIGDSFLKYAITSYLFNVYDTVHEGRLSHLRSKKVSNLNLFKLGRKKKLGECMIATKFEPHDNWLPPSYHVPVELEQALIQSGVPANLWNMAEFPTTELGGMSSKEIVTLIQEKSRNFLPGGSVEDMPSFVPYNLLTQHSIPDKSIADCVEALIGAYLISCGQRGALLFMTWLGLKVISVDNELEKKPLTIATYPPTIERQLNFFLSGYEEFEELIGYKFRDRSYLLQSFSHASFYPNRLTDCYQRLEFLGDAILDYLITRHLYEDSRQHSPGALTDLRSALVNNTIFAFLAVKFQFHKYFKHFSPGLQTVIDRFVKIQVQNEFKVFDEFYLIEEDDDSEEAEDIEVPKALGDIFESVAGAIFLDSGLSLDAVWAIYFRMMKTEIEQFSSNVPKSPIRELLELEPETAKFGKPEKLADGKRVRVSVEVFGKGTFKGIGRNYRIAKCTAAKCALRALKKSHHAK